MAKEAGISEHSVLRIWRAFGLSAVRINEIKNPQFRLERAFRDSGSAWDIYLYRLLSPGKPST